MNDLPAAQDAAPGSSADPSAAPAPPGTRWPTTPWPATRWMDRVTGALLFTAVVMTLVQAVPATLHALGVGAPRPSAQSAGKIGPLLPQRRSAHAELSVSETDDPSEPAELRVGVALRELKLLHEPSWSSAPVGEIAAGEPVMIVREAGGWALISQNSDDGLIMGWARRSELAVR